MLLLVVHDDEPSVVSGGTRVGRVWSLIWSRRRGEAIGAPPLSTAGEKEGKKKKTMLKPVGIVGIVLYRLKLALIGNNEYY
jgi:hypothetical protein